MFVFTVLSAVIAFGTAYSVLYGTYLDTSNPLVSHLPHPLSHSQICEQIQSPQRLSHQERLGLDIRPFLVLAGYESISKADCTKNIEMGSCNGSLGAVYDAVDGPICDR